MTEKKTFKNPWRLVEDLGYMHTHWCVYPTSESSEEDCGAFSQNEWDMEVTFTKKAKPFEVGSVVNYNLSSARAVIRAIDGDECWLQFSDGSHATWDLSDLRHPE